MEQKKLYDVYPVHMFHKDNHKHLYLKLEKGTNALIKEKMDVLDAYARDERLQLYYQKLLCGVPKVRYHPKHKARSLLPIILFVERS